MQNKSKPGYVIRVNSMSSYSTHPKLPFEATVHAADDDYSYVSFWYQGEWWEAYDWEYEIINGHT